MLKDSQSPRYSVPRTRRTYSPQFKAELLTACKQPGASIAALAMQHGMNANVLHRWLKEHAHDGRHQLNGSDPSLKVNTTANAPAFIPITLPAVLHEATGPELKVELRKGALSMTVCWPVSAAAEFAQWTKSVLK